MNPCGLFVSSLSAYAANLSTDVGFTDESCDYAARVFCCEDEDYCMTPVEDLNNQIVLNESCASVLDDSGHSYWTGSRDPRLCLYPERK